MPKYKYFEYKKPQKGDITPFCGFWILSASKLWTTTPSHHHWWTVSIHAHWHWSTCSFSKHGWSISVIARLSSLKLTTISPLKHGLVRFTKAFSFLTCLHWRCVWIKLLTFFLDYLRLLLNRNRSFGFFQQTDTIEESSSATPFKVERFPVFVYVDPSRFVFLEST